MKKKISISVKKPCSENFKNFKKTEAGGFCNSCKKDVIDFTTMTEAELINYFSKKNSSNTCGRFKSSQLKPHKQAFIPKKRNPFIPHRIGIMGISIIALCTVSFTNAQHSTTNNTTTQTKTNSMLGQQASNKITTNKYTVRGTILDDANLPLPGVNVILKGTDQGVVTDFDGKFEFNTALAVDDVLVFSYIGYDTKEYKITKSESDNLDINITFDQSDIELLGAVATSGVYKTKRTIFQKFTNLFK